MKLCFFDVNFLAICRLCHPHVRKDTRLSPLFHTASNETLGGASDRGYEQPGYYETTARITAGSRKLEFQSLYNSSQWATYNSELHIPLLLLGPAPSLQETWSRSDTPVQNRPKTVHNCHRTSHTKPVNKCS